MAGYRRFVIYLYWCGKEHVQNVGFAKIELQNNQCRIEIHLKGLPQKEQVLPVYLCSRDESSAKEPILWGVELGKIEIKRGLGKFGCVFPAEKIGNSPFRYQDMNGILIPMNPDEMVAGQWDNKDIIRQQFRIWQPGAEQSGSEQTEIKKNNDLKSEETEAIEKAGSESKETETAGIENGGSESEKTETTGTENTGSGSEKTETIETENGGFESEETKIVETDKNPAQSPASGGDMPQKQAQTAENNTLHMQQVAFDLEEINFSKKEPEKKFTREPASDWEQLWKMLSSRREVFAPMEGKDIAAVRIDLKDLHLLPEDLWDLGNNSFLLHGFFNYRFLLYGRIRQENGAPYYFIGIPGVFSNQEKVLAAIFGFPEFYLEKKAEFRTGQSGYWCKLLMSSDSNAYK